MPVIAFLGSTAGRWVRGVLGVTLGAVGVIAGQWWLLLLAPGLLFLASAVFDFLLTRTVGETADAGALHSARHALDLVALNRPVSRSARAAH